MPSMVVEEEEEEEEDKSSTMVEKERQLWGIKADFFEKIKNLIANQIIICDNRGEREWEQIDFFFK